MSKGESEPREGDWLCASCGTPHETNEAPCRACGNERFARLESERTPTIESTNGVEYRCTECGKTQPKNSTPCSQCGNLTFDAVEVGPSETPSSDSVPSGSGPGRRLTAASLVANVYGAFSLLNGIGYLVANDPIIPAVLWIVSGAVVLPATRRRLEATAGVVLSRGAVIVIALALQLAATALLTVV